jgi:hypothetical protein
VCSSDLGIEANRHPGRIADRFAKPDLGAAPKGIRDLWLVHQRRLD